MIDNIAAPRARLVTAFGTAIYFDIEAGALRHGPAESCPANAFFVADPNSGTRYHRGWLIGGSGATWQPLSCRADACRPSPTERNAENSPTSFDVVPLERGLLALAAGDLFLSAVPDGTVRLSASTCRTWELFLASEEWCTRPLMSDAEPDVWHDAPGFDRKAIQSYLIDPMTRVVANTPSARGKILIFGYPQWSHGRVYYDVAKHLHSRGYIVDILNWQVDHSNKISKLSGYYNLFMSALDGIRALIDTYTIQPENIIAISHHEMDMRMLIEQKGSEVFNRFGSYGVVSEDLYAASAMQGIGRLPLVAPLGINYDEFYAPVPEELNTVGYAGSMSVVTYGVEWKRGELAEAAARDAGLDFRVAGWTGNQISFHDMPEFYKTVDAVLISSISEGAGLPAMEAAAAGRLVIGTPVGHFPIKAYQGGGVLAPIEAEKYRVFVTETLRYYKENRHAFVRECIATQAAAKKFDWSYTIDDWVGLVEAAFCPNSNLASADSHSARRPKVVTFNSVVSRSAGFRAAAARKVQGRTERQLPALKQIHLINLDRSRARLEKFHARNPHLNPIPVAGVDGLSVDRTHLLARNIMTESCPYLPGSLGCALSHIDLWRRAAEERRPITIFEDDVACSFEFDRAVANLVETLPPDWDLIKWGYLIQPLFIWLDYGFARAKVQFYERQDVDAFQKSTFPRSAVRIAHSFGLQAYSVSPRGARKLLETCLPLRKRTIPFPGTGIVIDDTGIDCAMCSAYSSMNAFACVPPLVLHHDEQFGSDRVEIDISS